MASTAANKPPIGANVGSAGSQRPADYSQWVVEEQFELHGVKVALYRSTATGLRFGLVRSLFQQHFTPKTASTAATNTKYGLFMPYITTAVSKTGSK